MPLIYEWNICAPALIINTRIKRSRNNASRTFALYEQIPFARIQPQRDRGGERKGRRLTVERRRRNARPRPPGRGWVRWGRGGGASPRVAAPPSPSRRVAWVCPGFSRSRRPGFFPLLTPFSLSLALSLSLGLAWRVNKDVLVEGINGLKIHGPCPIWAHSGPVFWANCHPKTSWCSAVFSMKTTLGPFGIYLGIVSLWFGKNLYDRFVVKEKKIPYADFYEFF
jgi:hypothetical protein